MTITDIGTPIPALSAGLQFVDENGRLTPYAAQLLTRWREFIVGMNRIIPCNCTGTNTLTLTPLDAAPLIERYVSYEAFAFTAENSSTNSVTATVVPRTGTLATLKVYINGGSTQAGNGDLTANRVYLALYADHLDGGAGGLVLK